MTSIRSLCVLVLLLLKPFLLLHAAYAGERPPGVKALPVNGYDMAHVENGGSRPLIMVHGALLDYRTWSAHTCFGRSGGLAPMSAPKKPRTSRTGAPSWEEGRSEYEGIVREMFGGQLFCGRHHFEGIDLNRRRGGTGRRV
jgi:hypothetical protein